MKLQEQLRIVATGWWHFLRTERFEVVQRLDGPLEVVPVDLFLKLAASKQTYTTRYQDPNEPKHFKGY